MSQTHMKNVVPIPAKAGVGLRFPHLAHIASALPAINWLEIHPENFFGEGGIALDHLETCAQHYPLSFHGVGLSLGSATRPDRAHLNALKNLITRFSPALISEHVSWSMVDGVYLNDLLPLPYTQEALDTLCAHVDEAQEVLGRTLLMENPSAYLTFTPTPDTMPEGAFLRALAQRTGCGLLLDVNNVFVSAQNTHEDAAACLARMPFEHVGEIHLAGHTINTHEGHPIYIDTHGAPVSDEVWALYRKALAHTGPLPTLIEWDTDIPALDTLLGEAEKADTHLHALGKSTHAA